MYTYLHKTIPNVLLYMYICQLSREKCIHFKILTYITYAKMGLSFFHVKTNIGSTQLLSTTFFLEIQFFVRFKKCPQMKLDLTLYNIVSTYTILKPVPWRSFSSVSRHLRGKLVENKSDFPH